ncbi:MAG TPA: hypothetical protein VEK82_00055 [Stellaceae bacterium]|nr:hypothetical protein [Stellaceae bacterium]
MSENPASPPYLIQNLEQPPAAPAEGDVACAQDVLNAYMKLMRNAAGERQAFEQAARIYQTRNPGVSNEAARRAVAVIISSKP